MDGEIDPETVHRLCGTDGAPRIVDIRSPSAFARGHVPDSLNVPLPELPARAAALAGADHVVTVCPHGESSVRAARLLGAHEALAGARVESMRGGLSAWPGDLVSGTAPGDRPADPGASGGSEAPF